MYPNYSTYIKDALTPEQMEIRSFTAMGKACLKKARLLRQKSSLEQQILKAEQQIEYYRAEI